ncbi:hypothetical protein [Mycolicibacterium porcinum]|uniref:Uncharacterized protein n=1 Tax=Mycolicibacterium porcinum TaxID=39693 RepID=A0AAW5SWW1_9MYCO|nr:hypothetical protein [Mycolicibacterium porcinum]MCV7387055.1 hypothetical protein [Mycolicibacterium porcinum]CDO32082.1 hypothetical protein BN979_04907 [Mycolicibacterium vulneris]
MAYLVARRGHRRCWGGFPAGLPGAGPHSIGEVFDAENIFALNMSWPANSWPVSELWLLDLRSLNASGLRATISRDLFVLRRGQDEFVQLFLR